MVTRLPRIARGRKDAGFHATSGSLYVSLNYPRHDLNAFMIGFATTGWHFVYIKVSDKSAINTAAYQISRHGFKTLTSLAQ